MGAARGARGGARGGAAAAACRTWALLLLRARGAGGEGSCWVGGYSWELCCDPGHGPGGNPSCWDDAFSYDPCCTQVGEPPGAPGAPAGAGEREVLERSFGTKLDAVLAQNGLGLAGLEADLMHSLRVPENRSMSGPMIRAYLALVLHRQGKEAAASEHFRSFAANDFSIAANGAWVGSAAEGYHMHDAPFSEALVELLRDRGCQTVVDFGCGLGLYVRDLRAAGLRAGGFDGNPSTVELTEGRCNQLDLSRVQDLGNCWDWVVSFEVAEHIPRESEAAFVGNLVRHARRGLVLSWGNQAGEGHVNVRPRDEVERLIEELGFRSDWEAAQHLRSEARLPWLNNTVLVFERIDHDPCEG